jgi:hypothetical protein
MSADIIKWELLHRISPLHNLKCSLAIRTHQLLQCLTDLQVKLLPALRKGQSLQCKPRDVDRHHLRGTLTEYKHGTWGPRGPTGIGEQNWGRYGKCKLLETSTKHPPQHLDLSPSRVACTGGKGWCSGPEHCKFIAKKWTMCLAKTDPLHRKHILKFPGQFPCSVLAQKMVSNKEVQPLDMISNKRILFHLLKVGVQYPTTYDKNIDASTWSNWHCGQGVVFQSRTLQVHCKELNNVPDQNPPSTL